MGSPEEQVVKSSIQLLSLLVNPTNKNEDTKNSSANDFDSILCTRFSLPNFCDTYENLVKQFPASEESTWPIHNSKSKFRWKFLRTVLRLMKIIHHVFVKSTDEKIKLLSIAQKRVLETSFEFIITLGVLQNLLPGVGVSLNSKSKHIHKISTENLSEFAKHRRLCQVMDNICYLFDVDVFHDLIVAKHLEDVLAALFQLSFAPLKKPYDNKDDVSIDFNLIDDNFEIKSMTFSMWKKLEENREEYNNYLISLLKKIYKPLLVRKLSLLLNSKNIPRWMKQKLTKFLSNILKENNGVTVAIQGLIDSDSTSLAHSSCEVSIAKLISHECQNDAEHIAPQLLEILSSERKQSHDLVFVQVAAFTINCMFSDDPKFTEKYILNEIHKPFRFLEFSTEEEICNTINQLYNVFIIPSNNEFTMPVREMLPSCHILFLMFCRIKDSICYLKSCVKELLSKFLHELDDSVFAPVMNCFIFNSEFDSIIRMPAKKYFSLSASGGVRLIDGKNDWLEVEYATTLLELCKAIPENENVIRSLFVYLLKTFIDEDKYEQFAQKRLVVMIMLTELTQEPTTLRHILKDSKNIINFVRDLLSINTDTTDHDDIICVGLTFLTMVLYDIKKKKHVDWDIFSSLLSTVEKFKRHKTPEVKFLAEEVCNLIRTRGLVGNIDSSGEMKKPLIEEIVRSDCERYIDEACDPLLPVRAHALMELIALVKNGDPETLAKKEKIYCLFEENLKDQDSFLYLRAIEGLSCMATLKPEVILPLLCQEFILCSTSVTQMKIGEILVRTTKQLNDFICPHKKLLINTCLSGVKSEDSLIRTSSLSNLAEICLMLKTRIDDMLYEVLSCGISIAQYDKEVEPRRAAMLLVSSLFRGLRTSIFTVLESHLTELYLILKRIHSVDGDEVVRLHTIQALEILSDNTRQFLWSEPTFEKKINIMRPL